MSLTRIGVFALTSLWVGIALAAGGGSMPSGPSVSNFEPRELPPEEKAKQSYNAGIKSIKKAKDYEADAAKAATPEKKAKATEKANKAYNTALAQFTEAVTNKADMVEAWNYVGFANRHLGAYAESLEAYDHALSLNPKYFEAVEYRGEAYLGLNRIDDAKTAYMDLYRDARPLSDQLLGAMQQWVTERRADGKGLAAAQLDSFEQWLSERTTIAKQTASLGSGEAVRSWK